MTTWTETDKDQALEYLHEYLKPGDTVYTILRRVSRSGMTRHISALVMDDDGGEPYEISHLVAKALGRRRNLDTGGVIVSGAGMDMGFELVYNLGRVMFPEGFETWDGYWRNEPLDFDLDGGYALSHRWL